MCVFFFLLLSPSITKYYLSIFLFSVSFQQSSIHAIRSFSASFPSRRGSMATALMLGNGNTKTNQKNHEKRATNLATPDEDDRGPKRRLVRSGIGVKNGEQR